MNQQPLVSVVIPTYNRAYIIDKSIRSVLNQSYRNIELIIMDDGSTDHTQQVVESIADSRISYYKKENGGQSTARNAGAGKSKGDWIAFHDSDDTWLPDKLEKQMKRALNGPYDVIVCKLAMKQKDGQIIEYPKRVSEGEVKLKDDLYGIGTQTIVVKKSVFEKEQFDPLIKCYEDTEWLYRVLKNYRVYCVGEALVNYEVGEDSVTENFEKRYLGLEYFLKRHPQIKKESPQMAMHSARNLFEGWLRARKTNPAEKKKYWKLMWDFYPGILRFIMHR